MGKGRYLLILALLVFSHVLKAQDNAIQAADSTSNELYNRGDWKQVIIFGKKSIGAGVDFPGLRTRIAYAYLLNGNFKSALAEYDAILAKDAYNETARYYAFLCNKYLNNDLAASYNAGFLSNKNGLSPFGLVDAEAESSVKLNNDINRDNGSYNRIGLSNRLGWRWQLEESAAYYNQTIFKLTDHDGSGHFNDVADVQKEYYAKLSYAAGQRVAIFGSYHYLDTKFDKTTYNSNLGLLGIKYSGTYADIQADANFGRLDTKPLEQYNAKLAFYPLGNFNLYTITRASVQHLSGGDHFVFGQSAGFKLIKNTWLESNVTIGSEDDFLDADGLYVYNAVDNTTFRCGETLFYQWGNHAQLQLSYVFEKKDDTYQSLKYDQNAITVGIIWKF